MNLMHPLMVAATGTALGAIGVITFNVLRSRREARRQARREQMLSFARRNGLDFVGERARPEDRKSANRFRGRDHEIVADDFLQGQDRDGRFWVARRVIGGEEQTVFGFEVRGSLNTGTVYLEPRLSLAEGGTSWAKRLFSRSTQSRVNSAAVEWTVHREATAGQIADEVARNSIDRWVHLLVTRGKNEGRMPVGLEVAERRAWVFSSRPLEGARLDDFLGYALDLRGAVLQEVQRRPATITRPVSAVSENEARASRIATQPMFPVPRAEGADIDDDARTVTLTAADLLREEPKSGKQRKVFEIPEPDEEVEVIWARQ